MSIADNVARVHERMAAAARRAGRTPEAITLMAVSKTLPPDAIREAHRAGIRVFGENRVQEFAEKRAAVTHMPGARFHLIGHLQTNKAARAAELFDAIDSADSLRLLHKLDAAAKKRFDTLGLQPEGVRDNVEQVRHLPVLIEINLGGESAKTGVPPDSAELDAMLLAAPQLGSLRIRGLMTIPPFAADPEAARPHFRALRRLRDRIAARGLPCVAMETLSMGMSHDFEVAIEEGATCVRVGTAIFGPRKPMQNEK